jgi:glycosyl transferase family 4
VRICYVFQDEYPWDIRVEKFVTALADAGHESVILSRNRRGRETEEMLRPGVRVRRLARGWTSLDRTVRNFPAFFSPFWIGAIVRTIRRERLDLILVRDLPLAAAGIIAGRITGRSVAMDMAENYPAMIQATWDFAEPRPIDYILRNPSWLRKLERWVLPRLDGVFVVSDPSRRRVVQLT